jgi:hypothetical protein
MQRRGRDVDQDDKVRANPIVQKATSCLLNNDLGDHHVLNEPSRERLGWQQNETSDSASGAVGMAAVIASASERNDRFRQRRGGYRGGHTVGK